MDIVLKLRELRRLRGLSQKDVGRLSGVGEKTLSSFESGARIDSLKVSQLRRVLRVYSITEDEFFSSKMDELFDADAILEAADAGVEHREIVARKLVDGGEQSGDHVGPRTTFCDARHREHHHLVRAFRKSHRREW